MDIEFFKNIVLEDIYIEDQSHDTLFFIHKLVAAINFFSLDSQKIDIQRISLNNVDAHLKSDSTGVMNFQFIIDEIVKDDTVDSSSDWNISCKNFTLSDSRLQYYNESNVSTTEGINLDDLDLNNLNLEVSDFSVRRPISFCLQKLCFEEKSGFKVDDLSACVTVDSTKINAENLTILTPNSMVNAYSFSLSYAVISAFDDFLNRVKLDLYLDSARIYSGDLGYFATELKGLDQTVVVHGHVKGRIARLSGKDMEIQFGEASSLFCNFNIDGLPELPETFMHFDINKLSTNKSDLEKIKKPPFANNQFIELPDDIGKFGNITYEGKLTGFAHDFVTYGTFSTKIGKISSDISIKQDTLLGIVSFDGTIETERFDLGKITGMDSLLGAATFSANLTGYVDTNAHISAVLDASVESLSFKGYDYQQIKIDGELTERKFDGELQIIDPNIKMDFLGRIDFTEKLPVFDFTADVSEANLNVLNLYKSDSINSISFQLSSKMQGNDLVNFTGRMSVFNMQYKTTRGNLDVKEFMLTSTKMEDISKISVISDILDMKVDGKFLVAELSDAFKKNMNEILPSVFSYNSAEKMKLDSDFNFRIELKKTNEVFMVFFPDFSVSAGTIIEGLVNSLEDKLEVSITSEKIAYQTKQLDNLRFSGSFNDKIMITHLESDQMKISEGSSLHHLFFDGEIYNDSILFDAHWLNEDTVVYSGDIAALASFSKKENSKFPQVLIKLIPSTLTLADQEWVIDECIVTIDSSSIFIQNFILSKQRQMMFVQGKISENPTDTLSLNFMGIELENFNIITKEKDMVFAGILNGTAKITNMYSQPLFYSNLQIEDFYFNGELFGNTIIESSWNNAKKSLSLDASLIKQNIVPLRIKGDYKLGNKELDFDISLEKLKLELFNPYMEGIMSDLQGRVGGNLKLTGTTDKPLLNGILVLQRARITLDLLQTRYGFADKVNIINNSIYFENIKVLDVQYGSMATLSGKIANNYFQDVALDLTIEADKFLMLNSTEADNSAYYGTAFATGIVTLQGNPDNLVIDINIKTEKNTQFNIPLSSGEDVDEFDFISFVQPNDGYAEEEEEKQVDLTGVQLNFELEVTPDAEVQIIFDSKIGDIIKGSGNANLKMEINTLGNFNMYGDFIIEKGDYLFTLQNVINKKFDVEKGGTIKWNGSPYDAYIDLNAIYRCKTSLYDLVLDTSNAYKKRVPVECHLKMTEKILNPTINFDIVLPIPDEKANGIINNLTVEEKNKQILSLLILNQFYTPKSMRESNPTAETQSSTNYVGVASSELLSNQLSHWLSQISNDFDIGVNYRPGDEVTSDELEVALSTQLFYDRVTINGNVGVGGNQQQSSNIAGDFDVNVKLNPSGTFRLKGFTRSNENLVYESSPNTQGLGFFYREDFNSFNDLLRKYWNKPGSKTKDQRDVP